MSEQQTPGTDPMVGEVRFRVPLPILIPVGALLAIALVTIGMSKVLLAIPPEAATAVALGASANVLIAAAILARRKRMGSTSMIEMGVIVVYPIVIGIVIALLGIGSGEGHDATADEAPPAQSGPVTAGGTLAAADLQFASDAIELPAGEESEITIENEDTAPHNLWIYETAEDADALNDDAALFEGEDVGPGGSTTYSIPGLDKGEFPFLCRIHPAMRGTVTVQ